MRTRGLGPPARLLSAAWRSLFGPAGEQFKPWDLVVAVFGFTMAPDVSRRDIKFITCQDPMDLHAAMPNWKMTHLFENIFPELKRMGMSQDDLDHIVIENPRRYFDEAAP